MNGPSASSSDLDLNLSPDLRLGLNELPGVRVLPGRTDPLSLHRKLNEPPAKSVQATRAEGGTYWGSGRV